MLKLTKQQKKNLEHNMKSFDKWTKEKPISCKLSELKGAKSGNEVETIKISKYVPDYYYYKGKINGIKWMINEIKHNKNAYREINNYTNGKSKDI